MSAFLIITSILTGGLGITLVATAESVTHEVVGMITLLIAVVMFVGAGIIDAVNALAKRLPEPASDDAAS